VGNNMPVFFIRDGMKFPDMVRRAVSFWPRFCSPKKRTGKKTKKTPARALTPLSLSLSPLLAATNKIKTTNAPHKRQVHALKPNPKSHIQEGWRIADFFSHHPEALVRKERDEKGGRGVWRFFSSRKRNGRSFSGSRAWWRRFAASFSSVSPRPPTLSTNNERKRRRTNAKNATEKNAKTKTKKQHMFSFLLDDLGIPLNYRHMEGFGVHTLVLLNAAGKETLVKFHWKPAQGEKKERFFLESVFLFFSESAFF